jgi:hypothetical protein
VAISDQIVPLVREPEATRCALDHHKSAPDQHATVSMPDVFGTIACANDRSCGTSGCTREE